MRIGTNITRLRTGEKQRLSVIQSVPSFNYYLEHLREKTDLMIT